MASPSFEVFLEIQPMESRESPFARVGAGRIHAKLAILTHLCGTLRGETGDIVAGASWGILVGLPQLRGRISARALRELPGANPVQGSVIYRVNDLARKVKEWQHAAK